MIVAGFFCCDRAEFGTTMIFQSRQAYFSLLTN